MLRRIVYGGALLLFGLWIASLGYSFWECAGSNQKYHYESYYLNCAIYALRFSAIDSAVFGLEGKTVEGISIFLTAVATCFVAGFTYTLFRATNQQATLTRKAIDLGNREFLATHRPKMRLRYARAPLPQANSQGTAELHAANIGESDAIIQQLGVDIFPRTKGVPSSGQFTFVVRPWPGNLVVPPGKDARMTAAGSIVLSPNDITNIANGTTELCLLGIIINVERSTSFFRIFNPHSLRFLRAPADDEYAEWDYED